MGLTDERIQAIQKAPSFEEGKRRLDTLKAEAKAAYKKLAFKYHPDRNKDDPEAEAKFKALTKLLNEIQSFELAPMRPPPVMQVAVWVNHGARVNPASAWTGFGAVVDRANTGDTTVTFYDARRVATMRGF